MSVPKATLLKDDKQTLRAKFYEDPVLKSDILRTRTDKSLILLKLGN